MPIAVIDTMKGMLTAYARIDPASQGGTNGTDNRTPSHTTTTSWHNRSRASRNNPKRPNAPRTLSSRIQHSIASTLQKRQELNNKSKVARHPNV